MCKQRQFLPVTDRVIYNHLAGQHSIGIYPLLKDDTCYFLATDFDESSWQEDALAYLQSCKELHVSAALEISRSGQGAHVWIFFSEAIPAVDARRLGTALISYTCSRTRQLSLDSYDRFFPNQDTLPKGGFGNLIALPLQKTPREKGFSLFVDDNFKPYEDQWAFLATLDKLSAEELGEALSRATAGGNPLDVSFLSEEEASKPWQRPEKAQHRLEGPLPKELNIVLANQIYIEKDTYPSLKGESDILYIGKTKNSISARPYRYAHIEATGKRNRPRYENILKHYGPICFYVAKFEKFADDLTIAEQSFLAECFQKYRVYPPLNRMGK